MSWNHGVTSLACAAAVVLAQVPAGAQDRPDFSGVWSLNHALSDDVEAKIKAVAGSKSFKQSPHGWEGYTIFPRGSTKTETERVELRQFLLDSAPALERLEVEQTPEEVKTVHGEAGVRIFGLKRSITGTAVAGEAKASRQARWQADQLVLDTTSGKSRLAEVLTLVPARKQLIHALHYENGLLKAPLELRLIYDRDAGGGR